MDGTTNEYDGLEIEGFPSIVFFKGGDHSPEEKFKNKKVFEGERNVAAIIEFLKNNTHHEIKEVLTLDNEIAIEEQEKAEEEKMGEGEGEEGHEGHDHEGHEGQDQGEGEGEGEDGDMKMGDLEEGNEMNQKDEM